MDIFDDTRYDDANDTIFHAHIIANLSNDLWDGVNDDGIPERSTHEFTVHDGCSDWFESFPVTNNNDYQSRLDDLTGALAGWQVNVLSFSVSDNAITNTDIWKIVDQLGLTLHIFESMNNQVN